MNRNSYRLKIGLSLLVLFLSLTALAVTLRHPNFGISADVKNEGQAKEQYLPETSFIVSDFSIRIDKLSVFAPVIADVDGANKNIYFASLQRGVAQMAGTAKPDKKGNVVIFGHSNYYENDPGAYKQIFKNLDELNPGDEILIHYQDKDYKYAVSKQQIVEPTDTWVIEAKYDLTLITCWPPGTIEKRLVVFADLAS